MAAIDRVVLYVGAPKTGTTSVQAFLRDNRDALTAQGVYSPMAGRAGIGQHIELPTVIPSRRQRGALDRHANVQGDDLIGRRRQFLDELTAEVAQVGPIHTLLLFSEYMFSTNKPEVLAYRALFEGIADRFESAMYLRRQDQWLASLTLQARKSGGRADLELHAVAPRYFGESVRAWDAQSDQCHIRRLDPDFMKHGKLLEDFCQIIGAQTQGLNMAEVRANPAILQEQIELVDALNRKIEPLRFQIQILQRSRFVLLCTETLGGTPIGFRRDDAMHAFDSFSGVNRWLRETRDPSGPDRFFNVDFSGYEDAPDNSRRYGEDQLMALFDVVSDGMAQRGLDRPAGPVAGASRAEMIDHLVTAYIALRSAELEERRQDRLTAAAEAGQPIARNGRGRRGALQSADERDAPV